MTRIVVTAGGRWPADPGGALRRLARMTGPPTDEDEARRMSQQVTCSTCGGQATADRGRVFIAHRPRCSRRGGTRQDAL